MGTNDCSGGFILRTYVQETQMKTPWVGVRKT